MLKTGFRQTILRNMSFCISIGDRVVPEPEFGFLKERNSSSRPRVIARFVWYKIWYRNHIHYTIYVYDVVRPRLRLTFVFGITVCSEVSLLEYLVRSH